MKTVKTLQLFFSLALICFCLAACDKDDESLATIKEITFEGDASTQEINMTRTNWSITSVNNLDGGYMYDVNNRPMCLEGLGTLNFLWGSIIRDKKDALIVKLDDNYEQKERALVINLKMNEGFYQESITIRQKKCTSFYKIESIVYTLNKEEGDGEKEIGNQTWKTMIEDYTSNGGETEKTKLWPFYSYLTYYSFKSEIGSPYYWLDKNTDNQIDVPKCIENGKIILEDEKRSYVDRIESDNDLKWKSFEVDMVNQKQNIYSAEIYFKHLQLSYTLTLSRSGTDAKRAVKGKITKTYPYDCSPIEHQVKELPVEPD